MGTVGQWRVMGVLQARVRPAWGCTLQRRMPPWVGGRVRRVHGRGVSCRVREVQAERVWLHCTCGRAWGRTMHVAPGGGGGL